MTADSPTERACSFVAEAAKMSSPNAFNPYRDRCARFDLDGGPQARRRNLEAALAAALEQGVHSLWVARDLGHKGGRRTGIALTDDVHLPACAEMFGLSGLERATREPAVAEGTARDVWRALRTVGGRVWLWNVFPLHPHAGSNPFSNRCHTPEEARMAAPLLHWLLRNLEPRRIVAVGRDAERALAGVGVRADYVRHPSMAGQQLFFAGIERLYGVKL